MDRIAGFRDLQDRVLMLSWALKLDRITGLLFKAKLGVKNGQDYWIAGLTSNLPLVKKIERKEKRVNRD
jgi:hypothetical protein